MKIRLQTRLSPAVSSLISHTCPCVIRSCSFMVKGFHTFLKEYRPQLVGLGPRGAAQRPRPACTPQPPVPASLPPTACALPTCDPRSCFQFHHNHSHEKGGSPVLPHPRHEFPVRSQPEPQQRPRGGPLSLAPQTPPSSSSCFSLVGPPSGPFLPHH